MHIKLINKKIYYSHYSVKCAIGKRGISINKVEGDNKTPAGTLKIKYILYRKDRIGELKSKIKKITIKKNMGWCDDPNSKFYNKLIKFPFPFSAEKLYLKKRIYDLILITDYNTHPVKRFKGSAIFIHLATKNFTPTKGCIALKLLDMKRIVGKINSKSKLTISRSFPKNK